METNVDERSHRHAAGRRTGHIVETERDSMTSEEAEDFVCIPGRIAELDRVTRTARQGEEKCAQAFDIDAPPRRQLVENRTKRAAETPRAREEAIERLGWVLQFLHVREKAAGLHSVHESGRGTRSPVGEGRCLGQSVKGVVDFDGVELRDVVIEPSALRQFRGIKVAAPVFVLPAMCICVCSVCWSTWRSGANGSCLWVAASLGRASTRTSIGRHRFV